MVHVQTLKVGGSYSFSDAVSGTANPIKFVSAIGNLDESSGKEPSNGLELRAADGSTGLSMSFNREKWTVTFGSNDGQGNTSNPKVNSIAGWLNTDANTVKVDYIPSGTCMISINGHAPVTYSTINPFAVTQVKYTSKDKDNAIFGDSVTITPA
jgi:hypothetical protein